MPMSTRSSPKKREQLGINKKLIKFKTVQKFILAIKHVEKKDLVILFAGELQNILLAKNQNRTHGTAFSCLKHNRNRNSVLTGRFKHYGP